MRSSDMPYWTRDVRLNRRQVLRYAVVAGAGLLAMPLVGCGDGEKSSEEMTPVPTTTPVPPSGSFDSDGVGIHYETFGEGAPIVLVHGFMGTIQSDWVDTGLVETLEPVRRVIALDNRGHGESDKPHDTEAYSFDRMGQDVVNMMDYLGIEKADLFGYSMGAAISTWMLIHHQERLNSVILAGTGGNLEPNDPTMANSLYDALMADDPSTIQDPAMKVVRDIVDQTAGADREAIAACAIKFLPLEDHFDASELAGVSVPVIIIVGEEDSVTAGVEDLQAAIPGARLVTIPGPGTDHLGVRTTPQFKEEVLSFLEEQ